MPEVADLPVVVGLGVVDPDLVNPVLGRQCRFVGEPTEQDLAEAAVPPEPGLGDVESIQDLLAKQETREVEAEAAEEEEETSVATTTRDERLEPLDARVVPMQATEFMCKKCYLVKHRSQLADKRKMLCRDCA